MEQLLCRMEGDAALVIKSAIERHELPTRPGDGRMSLLNFVLFQAFRTPSAAAEIEDAMEQMVKALAAHEPTLAPHLDKFSVRMNDPVGESLREAALHYALISDLCYKLIVNRSDVPFITSDHPVVFYNQFMERRNKFGSSRGLTCKGLQILLPLSPKCCLILFDYDVYRVGGRSLSSVRVEAMRDDVIALNALQVANAQDQLYFTPGFREADVRRIVEQAERHRPESRTRIREYPGPRQNDGSASTFIHTSNVDVRTGLKLSGVEELPSARAYQLGNKVVHQRDPAFCLLHEEYVRRVEAGEYKGGDFGDFFRACCEL
jgi:hypothetical protein